MPTSSSGPPSQIVEACDAGIRPSRRMRATPHEILRFIGRGTSRRDYQRLKAALDRLQSTTVATSIRETTGRRLHRFSWINEWKECADTKGRPLGIELILADWFFAGVLDEALVLTIDPAYFKLTGGIERWLYRLVRKHGGRQREGWRFDFAYLHRKSGSLSRPSDFACDLRALVARQSLPGLCVVHRASPRGAGNPGIPARAAHSTLIIAGQTVNGLVLSGAGVFVPSGAAGSCHRAYAFVARPRVSRPAVASNVIPNNQILDLTVYYPLGRWISRTGFLKRSEKSGRAWP